MTIQAELAKRAFDAGCGFVFNVLSGAGQTAVQCTLTRDGKTVLSSVVQNSADIVMSCNQALQNALDLLTEINEKPSWQSASVLSDNDVILFGKYKGQPFGIAKTDPDFQHFVDNVKNTAMRFVDPEREQQRVALCAWEVDQ